MLLVFKFVSYIHYSFSSIKSIIKNVAHSLPDSKSHSPPYRRLHKQNRPVRRIGRLGAQGLVGRSLPDRRDASPRHPRRRSPGRQRHTHQSLGLGARLSESRLRQGTNPPAKGRRCRERIRARRGSPEDGVKCDSSLAKYVL